MNSYIKRKLEHINNIEIVKYISHHFNFITTTCELGINGEEIFNTKYPKWASLYKIKGTKQEANN